MAGDQGELQRYGRCRVEKEIGRGARSTVYLAWHEGLEIPVAVKVVTKPTGEGEEAFTERFMREAHIVAQLNHSNIVRVYDCGETRDSYYMVFDYIKGETCKDVLDREGPFDWRSAVRIVQQVVDGLNYATKKGVIHRDLKPENVMIDQEGNARITDMGLAKQVEMQQPSATADEHVLGTPYYMSPEQVKRPGKVDFRADVYSLGATFYHMVTGRVPFDGDTAFEIMQKHVGEPLTPPQEVSPELPEALCHVIVRAMAKEPGERYESYDDLMRELDALLVGQAEAVQAPGAPVTEEAEAAAAHGEEAVAAEAAREEPVPAVLPVSPEEMPVTAQNVSAKAFGVLALSAYVLFIACLHHFLLGWVGFSMALAAVIVVVGLSLAWGIFVLWRGSRGAENGTAEAAQEQLSNAAAAVCKRLNLPPVRLRVTDGEQEGCYAYSFFLRKAVLHVSGGWLKKAALTEEETQAFLCQSLAGVYSGDSDLRTLLAVPVGVLALARWLAQRLLCAARLASSRGLAQAVALIGVLAACAVVVLLFSLATLAGLMGLVFLAALALLSGFERSSRYAGDAVAAKVLGSEDVVKSMIVASGLASASAYGLLRDGVGPDEAEKWSRETPPADVRARLVESIAGHYTQMEHAPGTLEVARKLFCTLPFAADRLNRLAGLPSRASPIARAAGLAGSVYAGLLGVGPGGAMNVADLAGARLHAGLGAIAGAVAFAAFVLPVMPGSGQYASFILWVAVLAAALGCFIALQVGRQSPSVGRLGWAIVTVSAFLACTATLGLCFVGAEGLSVLAFQLPVVFALALFVTALAVAVLVRLSPRVQRSAGRSDREAG
ncbi:MAG: protein kinase [Candidatus Brocadiae bacterium]|nr:protein kinase [Candidatus Brocadiia bacterium]